MSSGWYQNIPVVSRLFGWEATADAQEPNGAVEGPSYPDYMLDPDAVVSIVPLSSLV